MVDVKLTMEDAVIIMDVIDALDTGVEGDHYGCSQDDRNV